MYVSLFYRVLVSGEDSGCILGIRGALYSVRGAGDRKVCSLISEDFGLFCHYLVRKGIFSSPIREEIFTN